MRAYEIVTAAASNILTTAEVKTHLKVDTTADDTYIDNLIVAATNSAQEYTNRFFISTEIRQYADTWDESLSLFKSPVDTDSSYSVKYWDADDTLQTLSTDIYLIDDIQMPARMGLRPNKSFPVLADKINAVYITYHVGVANAAAVDKAIKQAVLLTIGHWYQNREAVIVGRQVNEMPMSAKYLLDQYKIQVIR
tara:strand:+ start:21 stop:602 length:582 start_codon:yes stop_codon:yes gene_type:complete